MTNTIKSTISLIVSYCCRKNAEWKKSESNERMVYGWSTMWQCTRKLERIEIRALAKIGVLRGENVIVFISVVILSLRNYSFCRSFLREKSRYSINKTRKPCTHALRLPWSLKSNSLFHCQNWRFQLYFSLMPAQALFCTLRDLLLQRSEQI